MIEFLGAAALLYLLLGAVLVYKVYVEVKEHADMLGMPRWYMFLSKVLLWLPDRILRKKTK